MQNHSRFFSTRVLCVTALFMALTIAMSTVYLPVPGGHLYLCDIVIVLASVLLNPVCAFIAAGLGTFFADMMFYPPPMFVSLVVHGIQAVVISVFSHYIWKKKPMLSSIIGVAIGAVIMVVGYTLGKIYVYSTAEYAWLKLPYEIAQAAIGAVVGLILCWGCKIHTLYDRMIEKK